MKKMLTKFSVLAAVALAFGLLPQAPAHGAGVAVSAVAGQGTISPGLTQVPTNQSVTFSGTGVGGGGTQNGTQVGAAAGVFTCNFSGSGVNETQAAGSGTATGSCTGGNVGSATVNCAVNYTRVGAIVVLTVNCTATATLHSVLGVNVSGSGSGAGAFVFVPNQPPAPAGSAPITSYRLAGGAAAAG